MMLAASNAAWEGFSNENNIGELELILKCRPPLFGVPRLRMR